MKSVRFRRPPIKLDQESYRILHEEVLRRDGGRCQRYGSLRDRQVHHVQSHSLVGDDAGDAIQRVTQRIG